MCTRCSVAGSSQLPDSWEETARDERERARWEATLGVVKQLSSLVSDFGSLLERRLNSDLPIEIREQLRQLNHGVDTLSSLAPRPTSTSSMQVDHPPELDNDLPADLAVVDEAAQATEPAPPRRVPDHSHSLAAAPGGRKRCSQAGSLQRFP